MGRVTSAPALKYEVDPSWPQEFPEGWVLGQIGSVHVVEGDDTVVALNRQDLTDEELETSSQAPPVLVFDKAGALVHSWGDPDVLPIKLHGTFVDHERCVWITGMHDGIVQKYSWEGELLLQVGERGRFDSTDGTIDGAPLNSARDQFFKPAGVAVDPSSGEVFVADGYGNRRIVVLDAHGNFLRQWGRQATVAEVSDGEPGVFAKTVHGVALDRAGLVYVSDRQGDRIQVFEPDGTFVRNIWVRTGTPDLPDHRGTAWWVGFSPDPGQEYLFVMNGRNERVHVLDRESGDMVTSFGRPGHQLGAFTHGHTLAVDSELSVYVGETNTGRRIQKFVLRST